MLGEKLIPYSSQIGEVRLYNDDEEEKEVETMNLDHNKIVIMIC